MTAPKVNPASDKEALLSSSNRAAAGRTRGHDRLAGLDLARGLAVVGMVLVNFMYVLSHAHVMRLAEDPATAQDHSMLGLTFAITVFYGFGGRAVSIFLVLFGIGLMLQATRTGARTGARTSAWPAAQIRRYVLLILCGVGLMLIWEADILHFIGAFGMLGLFLVRLPTRWLLAIGFAVLTIAELLRMKLDYATGWQSGAIGSHYADLWSVRGHLRQLFFNGYHPIFPWLSLMIYGLCLGRLDLKNRRTLRRLIFWGLIVSIVAFALQALGVPAAFFPAQTLFILLGMANATWVIGVCLLVCGPARPAARRGIFQNMGRLALSHYPGHVLLGIVPIVVLSQETMDMSFEGSLFFALIYLLATGLLGQLWFRHHAQGPLERVMRLAISYPTGQRR